MTTSADAILATKIAKSTKILGISPCIIAQLDNLENLEKLEILEALETPDKPE